MLVPAITFLKSVRARVSSSWVVLPLIVVHPRYLGERRLCPDLLDELRRGRLFLDELRRDRLERRIRPDGDLYDMTT